MKPWTIIIGISVATVTILRGQSAHPNLLVTPSDVVSMKKELGKYPMFDKAIKDLKKQADDALAESPCAGVFAWKTNF